jgi:Asp-tRNA(Asn)/Glu-tRNA(Gln) amidotransferase A subunit family amidase
MTESNELTWMPAWQIRALIEKGEVSCLEVTNHFLARIEKLNPTLRAFQEVQPDDARAQATALDKAAKSGEELGPLHGIPVSVKSHIRAKGFILEHGTGPQPSRFDDITVERMRAAGAVFFGTNTMMGVGMDLERAMKGGGSPGVFPGFNWDAEALSPWDTTRAPGWSSSGGAAATVSRMIPVALGSDGGGSTRLPAAYSGVVGLHTSRGLIPHINYEKPMMLLTASYGPLARDVHDVALFTDVLGGPDGRDYVSIPFDTPSCVDSIEAGVEEMRLAWTENFGYADRYATDDSARIIALAREAAAGLASLGASVVTTDEVWEDRSPEGTDAWLAEPALYEAMVGPNLQPFNAPEYEGYVRQAESRKRNFDHFLEFFRDHDVIMSVTAQRTAAKTDDWERYWTTDGPSFPGNSFAPVYCSHTMIFNWLGFPAVSVPCGFIDGLPVGLQIASLPGREDKVLRVASAFQRAFPQDAHPPVS